MMKDYVASADSNASNIAIQRQFDTPLLGSTTYIYEVSPDRNCQGDASEADTRFMVLDKGNPLVSEFNSNGVNVKSSKPIWLLLHTVAGPANQCTVIVSFRPENSINYQLKLLGRLGTFKRNICMAELSSVDKNSNMTNRIKLSYHKVCNV